MNQVALSRLAGGCCALTAFIVAIIAGLAAENPADVILTRAVISMFVCYLIGIAIGAVLERAVESGLDEYRKRHPIGAPLEGAAREAINETRAAA